MPFSITENTASVVNGASSICIKHYNFPSSLNGSEGFEVAPEAAYPQQYHLRATATNKTNTLIAVTVIKENCTSTAVEAKFSGTIASVLVGKREIIFDKKSIQTNCLSNSCQ